MSRLAPEAQARLAAEIAAAGGREVSFVAEVDGDGTIVARITGTQGSYPTVGVMIRETLNPGATMAYAEYYNQYSSYFYYRTITGG